MLNVIAYVRRRGALKATSDSNIAQGVRLLSVLAWCGGSSSWVVAMHVHTYQNYNQYPKSRLQGQER